ncbi:MAG: glycosyltransferase family 9 protein [Endomicrobium sp.]|jgi:ADP-heptose:LPS heptosyltransferase|nr:glycosyltransferase family 9 protein [Endomicrobium sp.]
MKILIIKPSSFGDIIHALPCAKALKKVYSKCEISWIVFSIWAPVVKICLDVDKIITWDKKRGLIGFFDVLKKIDNIEYDLTIDLQGLLRSALLAKFVKSKIKLGVPGMKELSNFLIKEVFPENATMNAMLRNLEPVRFLTGENFYPEINIKVNTTCSDNIFKINGISKNFISLLPFARGKGKNWSVTNYNKLISLIDKEYPDVQIVVLGMIKDFGRICSDNVKILDLCGKTKIEDLVNILSKTKIAIGADTGPMHLSSILKTPSVFIFGSSNTNETAPYIGNFSIFSNNNNPKNINDIKPETIFSEIKKMINY